LSPVDAALYMLTEGGVQRGGVVEHRGIEYTVRAGLGPNQWVWTILPKVKSPIRVQFVGTRDGATASARQGIDRWLERQTRAVDKTG
jgi:hypothetical protein